MRTSVYFQFRGSPEEVAARMPSSLSFLSSQLGEIKRFFPPLVKDKSAAEIEVTPATLDAVLAWGRNRDAMGRTFLRSAYVEDNYERADIEGLGVAELLKPIRVEAPPVRNLDSAYEITWACSRCDRVRARQVGDLDVDFEEAAENVPGFRGHPELLFTPGQELLIAARWRSLLDAHGVETRRLFRRRKYIQVLMPEEVVLHTDRPPLQPDEEMCPGCGHAAVYRVALVEGDRPSPDDRDLSVTRELPVSIVPPAATLPPLAASTERVEELVGIQNCAVHQVGDRVPAELAEGLLGEQGWAIHFISESLLAALWDAGVTGLAFRPTVR